MWPGQTAPKGWIQLKNGAYVGVVASSGQALEVEWYDGNNTRRTTVPKTAFTANTNGVPKIKPSKFERFFPWFRSVAGLASMPLTLALTPTEMGDGTVSDYCGDDVRCAETGWRTCEQYSSFPSIWINAPCVNRSSGSQDFYIGFRSHDGSLAKYHPRHVYPDRSPNFSKSQELRPKGDPTPDVHDFVLWDDDRPITKAAEDLLDPVTLHGPLTADSGVFADVYEPLEFPDGIPDTLSAEDMNPNGYPADGVGVTVAPVSFPPLVSWPDDADWPSDHDSPGETASPSTPVNETVSPGTGTGTEPGEGTSDEGSSNPVNVSVTFPEKMDVTVTNHPQTDWLGSEPETETRVFEFDQFSAGPRWLGSECPEPKVISILVSTVEMDYAPICDFASGVRPVLLLLISLVGARIAWGAL